jgi:dihydrofolate reductase
VVEEMFECGAIITGMRTFDIAAGWGGHHPVGAPIFVLTHEAPGRHVGPGTDGTAVTDGIESALCQARAVAGERTIAVGAADVAGQYLTAGLLDEIQLNLVPILLGTASACSPTSRIVGTSPNAPAWSNPTASRTCATAS